MGKRGVGLRLVPLVLALAVVLSACSFSTDTVATVGGVPITRGELNAAVLSAQEREVRLAELRGQPPRAINPISVLQNLVTIRRLELVAREYQVNVNSVDLAEAQERTRQAYVADGQSLQGQYLNRLVNEKTAEIRPIVNAYGGNTLSNTALQAVVATEIERMRQFLASRGTQMTVGTAAISERLVSDQAVAFRNALAGRGVGVPPQTLEPAVSDLLQQLNSALYSTSDPDLFQQIFNLDYGDDNVAYQQSVRLQAIVDKLRPQWAPEVDALILQELRTDSQEKAQQAIQKGRAGTPFAELLREYQIPGVPIGPNDNTRPTSVILAGQPELQAALKEVREGAYSEPIPTADGSQFMVYRIVRIEKRAPNDQEAGTYFSPWFEREGAKYQVVYADPSLQPPAVPR